MSVIVPLGETSVVAAGLLEAFTVKFLVALQEPYPAEFQVCTHHFPAPLANVVAGVTEQVPVPELQPAWAAVYHFLILFPELSSTHR